MTTYLFRDLRQPPSHICILALRAVCASTITIVDYWGLK